MSKPSLTIDKYAGIYASRFGFHLVPLKEKSKLPISNDWGNNCLTGLEQASAYYDQNPNHNIGLALGPSNICSLDIDHAESFKMIMDEYGLPHDALAEYPTIKGKGLRVMFSVPDGMNLNYAKLNWPTKDDPKKFYTVFELRAATDGKQRFDVLPPSCHPDTGQPYAWEVQPPKSGKFPEPPPWLIAIWEAWSDFAPQFKSVCPWMPESPPKAAPQPRQSTQHDNAGTDVIGEYNRAKDITGELERYGYKRVGKRYLSPHSGTGLPGVNIMAESNKCFVHHASDPLCSTESNQPCSPFDLFCYYDHGGDVSKAVKSAAKELGIKSERRPVKPVATTASAETEQDYTGVGSVAIAEEAFDTEKTPKPTAWFKCLGYNNGKYYFLPSKTEQVLELSASGLNKNAMLQMAPLGWWEMEYPAKTGCSWDAATDSLMRDCETAGIYDIRKQRGRGAWYDNGKPVLHLGGSLIVEGKRMAISEHNSEFIYTKQTKMENVFNAEPASDEDARVVAEIFQKLSWKKPEHAMLALGWCILAPVCGALKWRPHIWITGGRGEGKSWSQSYVMKPIVGEDTVVYCQGGSTEAGIRQILKSDARPVMFDEAESEDSAAQKRIQAVLELARQASSDTGAEIVKGTSGGDGMSFNVRSMFMMGSINVPLKNAADESRFSVLSLVTPPKTKDQAEWFSRFEKYVIETLTDGFCSSIRARTYHLIPTIRHNSLLLAQAVAEVLGSQRMGDQVGSLLAGAFSVMYSSNKYTIDECRSLIKGMDFSDAEQSRDESDELSCINEIMQHTIRVEKSPGGAVDRSIGELIEISHTGYTESGVSADTARESLLRIGIRVESDRVWVANKHRSLSSILKDTPWGAGHMRMLLRINGAEAGGKSARFAGVASKYVSIPIKSI